MLLNKNLTVVRYEDAIRSCMKLVSFYKIYDITTKSKDHLVHIDLIWYFVRKMNVQAETAAARAQVINEDENEETDEEDEDNEDDEDNNSNDNYENVKNKSDEVNEDNYDREIGRAHV